MLPVGPSTLVRLRAFCAALFLLAAGVATPAAIATQSADECGMSCCIKDGYCCCSPHHARVKGQSSDEKPHLSEPELSQSCPESCATTRTSSLPFRSHPRPPALSVLSEKRAVLFFEHPVFICNELDSGASAPRAPPLLLLS